MHQEPTEFSDLEEFTEEQLGFAPLSSGLGLKNSSPVVPPKIAAASAQAANIYARPATPLENAAVKNKLRAPAISTATKALEPAISSSPSFGNGEKLASPVADKQQAARTAISSGPAPMQSPAANPSLRLFAFALDLIFAIAPLYFVYRWQIAPLTATLSLRFIAVELSILLGAYLLGYFLLSESLGGQTLGKMLCGLRVVEDDKYQKPASLSSTALRLALLPTGILLLGWGLLSCFWDSKRRPWQDRFTSTIVRTSK